MPDPREWEIIKFGGPDSSGAYDTVCITYGKHASYLRNHPCFKQRQSPLLDLASAANVYGLP